MKQYPYWVCRPCGDKHGKREMGVATFHTDKCDICGKVTSVTEPRDFGHLKEGWDEKNNR